MKLKQEQIEFAERLIGYIDSGERNVFLETVNSEHQIDAYIFNKNAGVYFSCFAFGALRIYISFMEDTDAYNEETTSLIKSTLSKIDTAHCLIWVKNENRQIIEFLKKEFRIKPDCGDYYYASIEFIMRREMFKNKINDEMLIITPYEDEYIDEYLTLLDNSMTFASPPPKFAENREYFIEYFRERAENNSFEAFWENGDLVGLYWRKNAEIDIMAVAENHQRMGYGSAILTRAIEMVFQNTEADYVCLYAVDWNTKGQSFYRKYGMEQNGHSYLLRLNNYNEQMY